MTPTSPSSRLLTSAVLLAALAAPAAAQVRLADESDRAAFRSWFVLLAEAQFERAAPEVTDCAALVRFAFREALRPHSPEWARLVALPFTPQFPDVRSAPKATAGRLPLFRVSSDAPTRYGEFANAKTLIALNTVPVGRDVARARPGDLLYFRQPGQSQPDHLMVVVGRSFFDEEGADWVVYHTGPSDEGPGEVRKVRLEALARHPSPRWRPSPSNPQFVGVFRLAALHTP
ncbi:MAG: DUF1175 family protein [Acidobacteria bacterium]|nr:DUF1175 family protein [Acidobacteriota bacterium]